jgi:hypothetical protein
MLVENREGKGNLNKKDEEKKEGREREKEGGIKEFIAYNNIWETPVTVGPGYGLEKPPIL